MNKADWSKAPAWAQWFAIDQDGQMYWYEFMPFLDYLDGNYWANKLCDVYQRTEFIGYATYEDALTWINSLEKRLE